MSIPWIQWQGSTCRYDSFLSIFGLKIYYELKNEFKMNQNNKHIIFLIEILIIIKRNLTSSFDFYSYLTSNKIDKNDYGEFGSPVDIIKILDYEKFLNLFLKVAISCKMCGHVKFEQHKISNILHIPNIYYEKCIQANFDG